MASALNSLRRRLSRVREALLLRRNRGVRARVRESATYWRQRGAAFANHYAPSTFGSGSGFVRVLLDHRVRVLQGWLRAAPGECALDVGCGHGLYMVELLRQGARVTGVDISPGMLARARQALESAGGGDYELVCAAAESAALPPGHYDLVLSVGLLGYIPDWRGMLGKLAGWAKPGCSVVFTIPKRPSPFFFLRGGPGLALRRLLFDLPPLPVAVRRRELEEAARDAGLQLEEVAACLGTTWLARARRIRPDADAVGQASRSACET